MVDIMMLGETPKLVIIESRRLITDTLKAAFLQNNQFSSVFVADSGPDALRFVQRERSVIYLICGQSYPSARQITRVIQQTQSDCTLVLLDHLSRQTVPLLARKTEIHGYWTYDDTVNAIATGLIEAANRRKSLSPLVKEKIRHENGRIVLNGIPVHDLDLLTDREMQLLQRIAKGYSLDDCALLLGIARKSVQNLLERLMRKLNIHSNVQLLWCAIRHGLTEM
ncbi:MAG: helix-turn-helix domain-containing protein [Thermoguttaceae bacterium]